MQPPLRTENERTNMLEFYNSKSKRNKNEKDRGATKTGNQARTISSKMKRTRIMTIKNEEDGETISNNRLRRIFRKDRIGEIHLQQKYRQTYGIQEIWDHLFQGMENIIQFQFLKHIMEDILPTNGLLDNKVNRKR